VIDPSLVSTTANVAASGSTYSSAARAYPVALPIDWAKAAAARNEEILNDVVKPPQ
jgi:hypothetical protein